MSEHSVAEARNQLSVLIDRVEAGERVVITRHGRPAAEPRLVRVPSKPKAPVTKVDMDWLRDRAITLSGKGPGAVETVIHMRHEDRLSGSIED